MSSLITFLARSSGLLEEDVRTIIMRAPVSYKHYVIPKRTGGFRDIAQPAREVKALQRILMKRLNSLPIHDAATAYRSGLSIQDNAERHARNGPIMKFDFERFFPSIRDTDWEAYCVEHDVFKEYGNIDLSTRLFFHRPPGTTTLRLAIGAPSSPWLSNVLMREFDMRVAQAVAKDRVTYTRYADDLTFSAPRTGFLNSVEKNLRQVMREIRHPRLKLNEAKKVVATKKYRRVVTGLVLANDGRVTIGRERKRIIRSTLDYAMRGRLDIESLRQLAGLLAFVNDIEPDFIAKLEKRYGDELLRRLANAE